MVGVEGKNFKNNIVCEPTDCCEMLLEMSSLLNKEENPIHDGLISNILFLKD